MEEVYMKTYTFNLDKRPYGKLASVLQFYTVIGLNFSRKDVRNLRMNPITNSRLRMILGRTWRRYYPTLEQRFPYGVSVSLTAQFLAARRAEVYAAMDWLNYSPIDDVTLPLNVLVEYEPGDEQYVAPRIVD